MRRWINLFEGSSFVPDLTQFVTPHLIDEIIDQNRWVHHGDELNDWLDGSCYASDNANEIELTDDEAAALEAMPHEQALHTPEFRKCVEHWVRQRAAGIAEEFRNGDSYSKIAPMGPDTVLTRLIRAQTPKSKLGVYWTELNAQGIMRVVPDHETDPVIILEVRAKDVQIDWYETLRSRLDYSNGCDESEVQLMSGSSVTNIRVGMMDYRVNGRNDFVDLKKIVWRDEPASGIA